MCSGVVIRVQCIASMTMNIPVGKMWEYHLYQRPSFSVRPSHCGWTRKKKQWRAMTLKASSICRQGTKKHSERILRAHAAVPPVAHHCNRSQGLMVSGDARRVHCFSFSLPCLDGCDTQNVRKLRIESYRCMFSRQMNRQVLCMVKILMINAKL